MDLGPREAGDALGSNGEVEIVVVVRIQLHVAATQRYYRLSHELVAGKVGDDRSRLEVVELEDTRTIVDRNTNEQHVPICLLFQRLVGFRNSHKLLVGRTNAQFNHTNHTDTTDSCIGCQSWCRE